MSGSGDTLISHFEHVVKPRHSDRHGCAREDELRKRPKAAGNREGSVKVEEAWRNCAGKGSNMPLQDGPEILQKWSLEGESRRREASRCQQAVQSRRGTVVVIWAATGRRPESA